jgi:Cu-processing system permease protein
MMLHPLALIARQELIVAMRLRWTQVFTVVFAALSLAVATSGYILSGGSGVQDFARTSASLLQLIVLVVPLASVVIGVLSLEGDRGHVELLFSQPVSRPRVLLGQMLGIVGALIGAEMVGFGAAGVVIFSNAGGEGLASYLLLLGSAVALTAIFVSIAALIAAGSIGSTRTRALAIALVVWFVLLIVFDIAVLGIASKLPSGRASRLLIVSALANPIDAIRTGALLGTEGTAAFGAASLALLRFTKGPAMAAVAIATSVLGWIAVPAILAMRRLNRADL